MGGGQGAGGTPGLGAPLASWYIPVGGGTRAFNDTEQTIMTRFDESMQRQNSYYRDLIKGHMLQTLKVRPLKSGAFRDYMRKLGKLGGQNKVPRLANDRSIAALL